MKNKERIVRRNKVQIVNGRVSFIDQFWAVTVMAEAGNYAMVRRPRCSPFCVPKKDLMPEGFTAPIPLE